MQLHDLTAVLALPPSLTVCHFLIVDKELEFTCFTSSSLHVAKYGRPGIGKFSILTRVTLLLHSNDVDSSDQSGKENWDVMTLFATW